MEMKLLSDESLSCQRFLLNPGVREKLVGSVVAFFCVLLIVYERWFLEHTVKGQRLIRWFGPSRGRWVLRGLAGAGILFGLLLANGIIRPIQW